MKKAQVTIFIILGIVLVAIVAVSYFLLKEHKAHLNIDEPMQNQEITVFVNSCLETSAKTAIMTSARRGGIIELSEPYFANSQFATSYHYYEGFDLSPSEEEIKTALNKETTRIFLQCIDDFSVYSKKYELQALTPIINTSIEETSTLFQLYLPITVKEKEIETKYTLFNYTIFSSYKNIINVGEELLNYVKVDPALIPQEKILELQTSKGVKIDTLYTQLGDIIYIIQDTEPIEQDRYLTYSFAIKYRLGESPPAILLTEQKYEAKVGEQFTLVIPAFDPNLDTLIYKTNSTLFAMHPEGYIQFTPKQENAGIHPIQITVSDGIFSVTKNIEVSILQ